LAFIRQLPCCIPGCGNNIETEAAHIRFADPTVCKPQTGVATRPDDRFVLPLCSKHHRLQHSMGERKFWERYFDPVKKALALYSVSGDHAAGEQIVMANV
jgi:hypothetical protein